LIAYKEKIEAKDVELKVAQLKKMDLGGFLTL